MIKRMLPLVATLMMGAFSQRTRGGAGLGVGPAATGGMLDMLTPLLDKNRDGSIVDDVTGMVGRVFGGGSKRS